MSLSILTTEQLQTIWSAINVEIDDLETELDNIENELNRRQSK